MKKFEVLIFMTLLALFSCNKEKSSNTGDSSSMNVAALPATVTSYINDNYPDATIYTAAQLANNEAKYIVLLSTEEELAFDASGHFLGDGQSYCHGGGPFPGGDSLHHGHPWHGCPPNWINIDSLSAPIKLYIATDYPNYQTWHAEKDSICPTGAVIEVMIRKKGSHPPIDLKLFFDLTNDYLMMAERIRFNELPQAVRTYINTNFGNMHQCDMAEKLTLADSSINYAVFIDKPHDHQRVVLTAAGTLVCEQ